MRRMLDKAPLLFPLREITKNPMCVGVHAAVRTSDCNNNYLVAKVVESPVENRPCFGGKMRQDAEVDRHVPECSQWRRLGKYRSGISE